MGSQINVNLLSGRAFELKKERSIKAKVQFVTAFVLICFLGMLVVVLGISTFVNAKLNQIKNQAVQEETAIKQLAFVEDEYLILQNKVALLEDLFSAREDVLDGLEYLVGNLPAEIAISNLTLDNNQMLLSLKLEAKAYDILNNFIDFALANIESGNFAKIDFEGISRGEDGTYTSKVTISYGK